MSADNQISVSSSDLELYEYSSLDMNDSMGPETLKDVLSSIDLDSDQHSRIWLRVLYNAFYSFVGDDEEMLGSIRDLLGDFSPPPDWAVEASRRLLGGEFFKNAEIWLGNEDSPFSKGYIVGFYISVTRSASDTTEEHKQQVAEIDIENLITVQLQTFGIVKTLANESFDTVRSMLKGIEKGMKGFFNADGEVKTLSSASIVYMTLILNADEIERFESVQSFYRFMKDHLGSHLPHDFDSFKKICHRIGFRGTKFSARLN